MLWLKTLLGITVQAFFLGLFIYLPAWTWYWEDAITWFSIFYFMTFFSCIYLLIYKPESLEARLNVQPSSQPREDKIATSLMVSAIAIGLIFSPLDVFHFQVTPSFEGILKISGLGIYVIGYLFILASMLANEFAEMTVNIQDDRGQKVIDTGVYAYVRHPMYTGFIFFILGTNLWLGTYLSFGISVVALTIGLYFRIRIEEKTLINELDGYQDYLKKVKFKVIPYII